MSGMTRGYSLWLNVWLKGVVLRFWFAGAIVVVIIDEACGLEEGVADGRTEESESSPLHVFAYGIGDWRWCRKSAFIANIVYYSLLSGEEGYYIIEEWTVFVDYFYEKACVDNSAVNFPPVFDYVVEVEKPILVAGGHIGNLAVVKIVESGGITIAFSQNGNPW